MSEKYNILQEFGRGIKDLGSAAYGLADKAESLGVKIITGTYHVEDGATVNMAGIRNVGGVVD